MQYACLRYRDGDRIKTVLLKDPVWREMSIGRTLVASVVEKDGSVERLHILMATPDDVVSLTERVMDLFYGEMVPPSKLSAGHREIVARREVS